MALKNSSLLDSHSSYVALPPNLLLHLLIFSLLLLRIVHPSPDTPSLPGLLRLRFIILQSPQGALIISRLVIGECQRHIRS